MSAGQLSEDQRRYRDALVGATGLDATVVTAWIGAESGWGITKTGGNYLNIGPGRTYASTAQAASAAASLVNSSPRYAGIRSAIPAGPVAQVRAIGASPWGTSAAVLGAVYAQLSATPMTTVAGGAELPAATPAGLRIPGTDIEIPMPWDIASDAGKAVVAGISSLLGPAFELVLRTGLSLVFTVGGIALIAMGLNRLTGTSVREGFDRITGLTGQAGTVRNLAS